MAAHEQVGSLAEEAAKLISALQSWAAQDGAAYDDERAADDDERHTGDHHAGEHTATECRFCPLCQLARFAKATSPEVREHLTSAALSMALAVKGLLEGVDRERSARRDEPVEKIDLLED